MSDPGVLEEMFLLGSDDGLLPPLTCERWIDSTSSETVTKRYSVEDGSRGLPMC